MGKLFRNTKYINKVVLMLEAHQITMETIQITEADKKKK